MMTQPNHSWKNVNPWIETNIGKISDPRSGSWTVTERIASALGSSSQCIQQFLNSLLETYEDTDFPSAVTRYKEELCENALFDHSVVESVHYRMLLGDDLSFADAVSESLVQMDIVLTVLSRWLKLPAVLIAASVPSITIH